MVTVTWNGTGAAWAPHFGNSSAVLETQGHRLLMDCGHTVPARLPQLGLALADLDAVFISHLHGDHVYGLEEWGFRNILLWQRRPPLLIAEELAVPLWERVLSGTMAPLVHRSLSLNDYFTVVPLRAGEPAHLGPWRVEIRPVQHVPGAPAYGLRVRAGDVALGFTCDARADQDPWFYESTARVFHDCSFSPYFSETVHSHYEELCAYPAGYRERTCLVHYEDHLRECTADPEWQAKLAKSRLSLAEPGVTLEF